MYNNKSNDTSWQKVSKWYNNIVGSEGHYYHRQVVLPGILKLLDLKENESLIDFACGQGILAKNINPKIEYCGVDLSRDLIEYAKREDRNPNHHYILADASTEIFINKRFDKGSIVLALQNIRNPNGVLKNANKLIKSGGKFVIILNHPCYRIPRHSFWDINRETSTQSRRLDAYMTPMDIPILANPGVGEKSERTWSFHLPISEYSKIFFDNGFYIEKIEEWVSDKKSIGSTAKMENRSRQEFPLFMAISLIKK